MIAILFALFAIGLIFAFAQHNTGNVAIKQNPNKKQRKRKPKVQSWDKHQKRVWKAKARSAMCQTQFVILTLEEADKLFVYNHSEDEMKLIDTILNAKLDGANFVKIERTLYGRMKSAKECQQQ